MAGVEPLAYPLQRYVLQTDVSIANWAIARDVVMLDWLRLIASFINYLPGGYLTMLVGVLVGFSYGEDLFYLYCYGDDPLPSICTLGQEGIQLLLTIICSAIIALIFLWHQRAK